MTTPESANGFMFTVGDVDEPVLVASPTSALPPASDWRSGGGNSSEHRGSSSDSGQSAPRKNRPRHRLYISPNVRHGIRSENPRLAEQEGLLLARSFPLSCGGYYGTADSCSPDSGKGAFLTTKAHRSSTLGCRYHSVGFALNPAEIWGREESQQQPGIERTRHPIWRRTTQNYDEGNEKAIMEENNGLRVWYNDYTTIDWIHDNLKESVRLRQLRSRKGLAGTLSNAWDGCQAWILVLLIGMACGIIAAMIGSAAAWLSDLKSGYCMTNVLLNQEFCCWNLESNELCTSWKPWSTVGFASRHYVYGYIIYIIISCSYATLSAILVKYTANIFNTNSDPMRPRKRVGQIRYFAAGSGVPEIKTILSGFVVRGLLGLKTLWVKAIGLVFSVASGLTVGMAAPLVHMACCIGNVACRLFVKYEKNEGKRREMLSAASAAGISVAFGAPIGGVLFSLEEISYYFPSKTMWRSFFCAMIAAMTLKVGANHEGFCCSKCLVAHISAAAFWSQLVNPFRTGKLVKFQVTYDTDWRGPEVITFLVLGVFGGIYGAMFTKLTLAYQRMRKLTVLGRKPVVEVILVTLATALVNYLTQFTTLSSDELVAVLFSECRADDIDNPACVGPSEYAGLSQVLTVTLLSRVFLTAITFGLRVPLGVFVPSMVVGALFGRLLGMLLLQLQQWTPGHFYFAGCPESQCVIPGVYAMVGGAAALAGVTRMSVCLVVIMFELTGALTYSLPIMISVMVSKWVADFLCKRSLYDLLIEVAEHPYLDNKREYIHTKTLLELVDQNPIVIDVNQQNTLEELEGKLRQLYGTGSGSDRGVPILLNGRIVAYIAGNELEHALGIFKRRGQLLRSYFGYTNPDMSASDPDDCVCDFTPYLDHAPLCVFESASMELVLELFVKLGLRYLCVNNQHGEFIGVVDKKALLMYLREL